MKPEDFRASTQRPFTGEEYLKSLQDGREIYIYGERVKDVTTHPAFRNAAASVAQLYDALHKPEMQDSLCWNTDTGSGGYTHKFFRVAKSADDLRQQVERALADAVPALHASIQLLPDGVEPLTVDLSELPEGGAHESHAH